MSAYANRIGYTDVEPFEVIGEVNGKSAIVRAMKTERNFNPHFVPGGFAGHCTNNAQQQWHCDSDASEPTLKIRRHKNGQWYDRNGNRYRLAAVPVKHYDFNF